MIGENKGSTTLDMINVPPNEKVELAPSVEYPWENKEFGKHVPEEKVVEILGHIPESLKPSALLRLFDTLRVVSAHFEAQHPQHTDDEYRQVLADELDLLLKKLNQSEPSPEASL